MSGMSLSLSSSGSFPHLIVTIAVLLPSRLLLIIIIIIRRPSSFSSPGGFQSPDPINSMMP